MLFNLNVFQVSAQSCRAVTFGIVVNAPSRKVYNMFTNGYDMSTWGAQKINSRSIRLSNQDFIIADEVTDKYIEWRCLNTDSTLNYSISFELVTQNSHTMLNFSQKYWGSNNADAPGTDWHSLLLLIKAACEKSSPGLKLKIASIF